MGALVLIVLMVALVGAGWLAGQAVEHAGRRVARLRRRRMLHRVDGWRDQLDRAADVGGAW